MHRKLDLDEMQARMARCSQKKLESRSNAPKLSCDPILVPSPFAVPFKSHKSHCSKCTKNGCKKHLQHHVYELNHCTFKGSSENGIILDKPGLYRLVDNLDFYPTVERTTAITIVSSNVILDLGQYTLAQKNAVRYTYGIAIARDVSNVKITGVQGVAQVLDFSLIGIRVMGRTNLITIENVITTQSEIRRMTDDDIQYAAEAFMCSYFIKGICVGEGGTEDISFAGTSRENLVRNILIQNVTAMRTHFGLYVIFTFGLELYNSDFTENTSSPVLFGSAWPVFDEEDNMVFPLAANGVIRNCHVYNNTGLNVDLERPFDVRTDPNNPEPTYWYDQMICFVFWECSDYVIEDCTFHDNYSNGFYITGCDHDGAHNMVYRNCSSMRNKGEEGTCDGFHMSGSGPASLGPLINGKEYPYLQNVNCSWENCSSFDNIGGGSTRGFNLTWANGVSYTDCKAHGNNSTNGRTSGFSLIGNFNETADESGNRVSYIRCSATNNGGLYKSRTGSAGFAILKDSENVIIRDCIANGNGTAGSSRSASGILIDPFAAADVPGQDFIRNIVVENCIINGNGNASVPKTGGIIVTKSTSSTVNVDKILLQKNTLTYNTGAGIGVYGNVTGVVIKANEADQNTGIGFDVSQDPNPTLVAMNVAYSNNGGTHAGNYAGVNANAIIQCDQNTLPDNVGAKNLSVITI